MNSFLINPHVIFEVANVHGGDKKYLFELISRYKEFSYDRKGIKFQVFSADGIALPDFGWYPTYQEICFKKEDWSDFLGCVDGSGKVWLDIFDCFGVEVLAENLHRVSGIKLQASVVGNSEVLRGLKGLRLREKEIILNVSGFSLDEISEIHATFEPLLGNIIFQIGFQDYPTQVEDTALHKLHVLKAAFPKIPLCFADHADAETDFAMQAPIYGVLLGADYIEKHFCLERSVTKYDAYSSLEPDQVNGLLERLDQLQRATSGAFVSVKEKAYLDKSIQIPVLAKNVDKGTLISDADLVYRRTSQQGMLKNEIEAVQKGYRVLNNSMAKSSAICSSDYRKANVAAIVACRMKSSRLKNKAILPIHGISSVERCLQQCSSIQNLDKVVLATSGLESDSCLADYTLSGKVSLWQGDPDDVISRYVGACEHYGIDVVVRVTADCPIVLPDILEYLLEKHFEYGADYTAAQVSAVGSTGEIINTEALKRVSVHFGKAQYSEYMTWYFRNNPEHFKLNIVSLPDRFVRDYRLTLDYKEDLDMLNKLYERLEKQQARYEAADVFSVLDANPELSQINKHLKLKYRDDKELIAILDKETRMQ